MNDNLNLQRVANDDFEQEQQSGPWIYFSAESDASSLASRFMIELAAELRSSIASSSEMSSSIKPGAQARTTFNETRDRHVLEFHASISA